MKKYIFGAVFSLVLLASPSFTQAASLSDAQVKAILGLLSSFGADSATIASVNATLGGAPTTGETKPWCHTFGQNLYYGAGWGEVAELTDEVSALQTVLQKEGFSINNSEQKGGAVFQQSTLTATIGFQQKYNISQTGYVGPLTRTKLNSLYGCSNPPIISPPIPTAKISAEPSSVIQGQATTIMWGSRNATSCELSSLRGVEKVKTDGSMSVTIPVGSYSVGFTIVCGNNYVNSSPASVTVTATPPTTYTPMVKVIAPNGGETWTKGTVQTITWLDNTPMVACPAGQTCVMARASYDIQLVQYAPTAANVNVYTIAKGSFDSSYSWAVGRNVETYPNMAPDGQYTIQVCQTGSGSCDSSDNYFKIVSEMIKPSITVTSPNGGETYKDDGGSIAVNWQTTNVPSSQRLDVIRLRAYPNGQEYNVAYNVLNDGQEIVTLSSVPVGAYTLEIKSYVDGNLVMDSSDSYFKIVSGTTSAAPTISSIQSKASPVGTIYVGENPVIYGTGLSGKVTIWLNGNKSLEYSPSTSDTFVQFVVPSISAGNYNITVTNSSGQTSNPYQVTVVVPTTTTPVPVITNPTAPSCVPPLMWDGTKCAAVLTTTPTCSDPVAYYYYKNPDVKANGMDALYHWNNYGFGESRASCWSVPTCSNIDPTHYNNYYYYRNPDVKAAGMDALYHWNTYGYAEGRVSCPNWPGARSIVSINVTNQTASALNALSSATDNTSAPTITFNYEWTRDLQIGSPYTADVKALQIALTREGVYASDISGGFYNQTYWAVKDFQQKYGINSTGYVGQVTRAKLNVLY